MHTCGVLLTPGIGPGVAVPFFVAEASYFAISEILYISAVDPSGDYTEIAVPEPIAVSEICGIEDSSAREMAETSFNLLAVSEAMKDSYIRYDLAEDANSTEWMAVQLSMVQNYASEMTRITSELKFLIEPNLEGVAIPTEEEIQEIKQNISEFGLPEIEVCTLTALGYTQEEIEQVKNATLDFPNNYFVYFVDIPDMMDNVNEGLVNFSEALPPLPEDVIVATIDIDPDMLNLKSKGEWITAYIEFPEGYNINNIDISTVKLNGIVSAENDPKYGFVKNIKSRIGDYDSDGIPDSMVKFKRSNVQGILEFGKEGLAVTGQLSDGTVFGGVDTIRVI